MKPHPLALKIATLVAVVVLLMIALMRIGGLVDERTARADDVRRDIEASQAGRQALLGPVMRTTCREDWSETERRGNLVVTRAKRNDFLIDSTPDQLDVKGRVAMEPRYRGLFKANTYVAATTLAATWSLPALPTAEHAGGQVTCEAPVLAVAVSDSRGLRDVQIRVDGKALALQPGTPYEHHPRGFQAKLPGPAAGRTVSAEIVLQLVGSSDLAIAPVADRTTVNLGADWPHPSFGGRFLPTTRTVDKSGFEAGWSVTSLATTAPREFLSGQKLCSGVNGGDGGSADTGDYAVTEAAAVAVPTGGSGSGCIETFGVGFVDPVNPYSLTNRALKYGLLFIALSFVAVGMVELLGGVRVHPVQYLLVGCALALFFLLLLSLSEHLPFGVSYAIAAGSSALLLTYYARHVLGRWRAGLGFGAGIGGLYGALYVLLQREQTALVLGSVMLFAVLTAVMVATRRIDWYGLSRSTPTEA